MGSVFRSLSYPAWPFFVLGFLLPIDTFAEMPAWALDATRYGLALGLIIWMLSKRRAPRMTRALAVAGGLMLATSFLGLLKAGVFSDSTGAMASLIGILSVAAAILIVRNQLHFRAILCGFALAATWSSIDIISQWAGGPFFGTPTADSYRYAGFGFSSTHTAPLIAVALCIAVTRWSWPDPHRFLRFLMAVFLGWGLFLSQGRVGVIALLAAILVLLLARFAKYPKRTFFSVLLILVPVLAFTNAGAALSEYILRADRPGGVTSGRFDLNGDAWSAFLGSGALGVDPSSRSDYSPHLAPLTFALDVGPFGLLATVIVCVMLGWLAFFGPSRIPVVFRMIAAVALVVALIEPGGFFTGFSRTMLVATSFASLWNPPQQLTQAVTPPERHAQPARLGFAPALYRA